jgi:hypothetical protein
VEAFFAHPPTDTDVTSTETQLRKTWGESYAAELALAQRAFDRLPYAARVALIDSGLANSLSLLTRLNELGRGLAELDGMSRNVWWPAVPPPSHTGRR